MKTTNTTEDKKCNNGRILFRENGFSGVKGYDNSTIISPTLQYSDIRVSDKEEVAIACKENKWALIDLQGKPLCPFIYDRIVFIGEHCYKAGIYIKSNNHEPIVEYADTRMTYAILSNKGDILCDRNKGYHYISEIYKGETTAAINGKCGIIDISGNVIMDFKYKYIQSMGEGNYLVSYEGEENYYATIIDKQGNILIPSCKQYRSIYHFQNHVAIASQNGKWGLINNNGEHVSDFDYSFIAEWGEGYYKAEKGSKKNIMRPDGTLVLENWHNDVFKVSDGYFIFSNTIRKSKSNPETRYINGIADVHGNILFPMEFTYISIIGKDEAWENNVAFYAENGEESYILFSNGSHISFNDLFVWNGIKFKVCEKCIFAHTIVGNGEGCTKLNKRNFQQNYVKGICIHHKTKDSEESAFESIERREEKRIKDKAEKSSDIYAIRLLKDFIEEKLDGNIDLLRDFDLSSLRDDSKYGDCNISRSNIAKSIVSIAFGDCWPGLTVDALDHYDYQIEPICQYHSLLGANIMDEYFKGLNKFNPSEELQQRAIKCAHMTYNIGNLIVLPNKFNDKDSLSNYRNDTKFHGYMDKYLPIIFNAMTDEKKQDLRMKGIMYKNRKMLANYQGEEGFRKFIHAMMLEAFIDETEKPKSVFMGIWSTMKDLERNAYIKAVEEYIIFCNNFIPERSERIIQRIKEHIM